MVIRTRSRAEQQGARDAPIAMKVRWRLFIPRTTLCSFEPKNRWTLACDGCSSPSASGSCASDGEPLSSVDAAFSMSFSYGRLAMADQGETSEVGK